MDIQNFIRDRRSRPSNELDIVDQSEKGKARHVLRRERPP